MDCTLAALFACFHLSGIYVDSGLSYQDVGVFERFTTAVWSADEQGIISEHTNDAHTSHNPYGRIALGYEMEFRKVTWSLEASHVSSVATNKDRGINSLSLSMRWYPFR